MIFQKEHISSSLFFIIALMISITYLAFGVTNYTNQISTLEQQASMGLITGAAKLSQIDTVIAGVSTGQVRGLLLVMCIVPFVFTFLSYVLYKKHYDLDEEKYDRIVQELAERKASGQ